MNITVMRYLDFLLPLVLFPFSIKPFSGNTLKNNIQAHLNFTCFVAHNPSTTLVILQLKFEMLLWKPHRFLHTIFFLSRGMSGSIFVVICFKL